MADVPDWLVVTGAVTGPVAFVLSLVAFGRQVLRDRAERRKSQVLATTVTAEFTGLVGNSPKCRVTCHNGSSGPLYDIHGYVDWYAFTQWDDEPEPSWKKAVEVIGLYHVEAESHKANEVVCDDPPSMLPSETPIGPFPVYFTCTDSRNRRWERRLDGKIRKPRGELLGQRETGQRWPKKQN